eukprot:TRINITY_DN21379_c0_g1_i1.p1 TRINITY_DN21379_c0_g1~~TRINITY_DN21379_c0_g1_i1.p1  ORF type:complete len:726 (+),score=210.21 TRINITY_DN21379_c0_g1_i1:747-2924(+)
MQAVKEVIQTVSDAITQTAKVKDLGQHTVSAVEGDAITTNWGTKIANTDTSLKAGARGPSLLEDFHLREKISHFDHERIPERAVHARGNAAHGYFQVYESLDNLTKADFLRNPTKKTPVFVRFSTVAGSKGSADSVRDVRGFAVKFYTDEGNFDIVGNNIPVFFIQDAIKFPDLIHAVKPEPDKEVPQAQSAHDNFWDFVSLVPESTHMLMWTFSDRTLPRSYRTVQGFGVHSFVLVNAAGKRTFVKFHWTPLQGTHSLVWDESVKLQGADPDWLRRDLWDAIEQGDYPEWELGIQVVEEEDEHKFDFDILDSTKIIPEELVPVRYIGKMTLNKNPDNYFAETEQVAYSTTHLVPGIETSNDPLLQGRNFSYQDTQITRLGGPNWEEIPINRPICPYRNNQREGAHRMTIDKGKVNYWPNRFGTPAPTDAAPGQQNGYHFSAVRIEGMRERMRGPKFSEHYYQARLFYNSLAAWEKKHLIEALQFEIAHVEDEGVRQRIVANLNRVDLDMAQKVAQAVGVDQPTTFEGNPHNDTSPAVSLEAHQTPSSIKGRRIAFILGPNFNYAQYQAINTALKAAGAQTFVVGPHLGNIPSDTQAMTAKATWLYTTGKSVIFDALVLVGGDHVSKLSNTGVVIASIADAFKHGKALAALDQSVDFLEKLKFPGIEYASSQNPLRASQGVVTSRNLADKDASMSPGNAVTFGSEFFKAVAAHRHPYRDIESVPA